jgi:uncharacterized protein (DUF1697 family)
MTRYVAFLRGMNLGRRRIANTELAACFGALGLEAPTPFLASGNVVFDTEEDPAPEALAERIESGLTEALGFDVPVFLRSAAEVRRIADHRPFAPEILAASKGKLQVCLLGAEPRAAARRQILGHATDEDRLDLRGRELYWLPSGGILESELDLAAIGAVVGPSTMRTHNTVSRLAAKFLAP